jgi:predicted nuclease of predicted toxin-antitoxin system
MAYTYRFLIDRRVAKAAALFPKKPVVTLDDVGLAGNASDRQIVEKAHEDECIIVTANGEDFLKEIGGFQKTPQEDGCRDL